ncbi:MAG: aldo/keto reductase [Sphingomonas sp.]
MTDARTASRQPMLRLNDGREMPQFGLGTYKIPDSQAAAVVRQGLDLGIRLIDTAALYRNERGVGRGLAGSDAWLTTKLWNDRQGHDAALSSFEESRALLGRDVIDLYLIHWPVPSQDRYVETWKALVELRRDGGARSIGVSNFTPDQIERIADATGEMPAVNQIELHPDFQQRTARAFHEKHGIVTQSWSPLGQGSILKHPEIVRIAERHHVSAAQVVLAWHLAHGLAVIPKAADPEHLTDNVAALDLRLDEADIAAIDALDDPDGRIGPDPMGM